MRAFVIIGIIIAVIVVAFEMWLMPHYNGRLRARRFLAQALCQRAEDLYYRLETERQRKALTDAILNNPHLTDMGMLKGGMAEINNIKEPLTAEEAKRYDEVLKAFDKALELSVPPGRGDQGIARRCWEDKGDVLFELQRYDEAMKAYDKAIVLTNRGDPVRYDWFIKGNCLIKSGKYAESIKLYDKAIELDPKYAETWYNRACAYSLLKDKKKALNDLGKALQLKPELKSEAAKDSDFQWLWDDEEFKKIVN